MEKHKKTVSIGEMQKRRVKMKDGQRYLIYYTFGNGENINIVTKKKLFEDSTQNSIKRKERYV